MQQKLLVRSEVEEPGQHPTKTPLLPLVSPIFRQCELLKNNLGVRKHHDVQQNSPNKPMSR